MDIFFAVFTVAAHDVATRISRDVLVNIDPGRRDNFDNAVNRRPICGLVTPCADHDAVIAYPVGARGVHIEEEDAPVGFENLCDR